MIYDSYKAKIAYVAKILAVIKKYRVLIVSVLSAIVFAVAGVVTFNGTVYGDENCPVRITYGEQLPYQAKALFNTTSLEFSLENGNEWFPTEPSGVGTYRVRAVSTGSFGVKHYGTVHTYTVAPKEISVSVVEETIYGELPSVTALLAYDDYVVCNRFTYGDVVDREVSVEPQKDDIIVYNADGEDVTRYYNVSVEKGTVRLLDRKITLSVADASHVYDGEMFSMDEYTLSEGTLADGDEIRVRFTATVLCAGERVKNVPTVSIVDKNGDEVTEYYDIQGDYGYLTVEKRAIEIQTQDDAKTYDGTPLEAQWEINTDTPLVDAHNLQTLQLSSIVNVGKTEIQLKKVVILDENSVDVTANYNVFCAGTRYLEVTKRSLRLRSEDKTDFYNGERFTWERYYRIPDSPELPIGEEIVATFTGYIDGVGTAENTFTVDIYKNGDERSTDNYKVEYTYGELYIRKRPVFVTTHTIQWVYDGKEHVDDRRYTEADVTVTETYMPFLWAKHEFVLFEENQASVRFVSDGETNNNVCLKVNEVATGNDVSDCYAIDYSCGTLSVTPRPIAVNTTHNCSWTYDGKKHFDGDGKGNTKPYGNDDLMQNNDFYALADGDSLQIDEVLAEVINVKDGEVDNRLTFTVADKDGNSAVENYTIQQPTTYGKLTIEKRAVSVKTHMHSWVYDGTKHGCDSSCKYDNSDLEIGGTYLALVDGHTISMTSAVKNRDVGEYDNTITFTVEDARQVCVDDNYSIECVEGKITIIPRKITCTSESSSKIYDGTPLQCMVVSITDNLADGETASYTEFNSRTNVGTSDNTFRVIIQSEEDSEVRTGNYAITYKYGNLTVSKRPIRITTHSHEKTYDGTSLSCANCTYTASDLSTNTPYNPLIDGHSLVVDNASSITYYGNTENMVSCIVLDGSNNNVTDNYDVSYTYDTLSILKRNICMQTHTHSWTYDGKAHSCKSKGCAYTSSDVCVGTVNGEECLGLPGTDCLQVSGCPTIAFNHIGDVKNTITFKVVCKETNFDVSESYNFVQGETLGTLSITKRAIVVDSASDTITYDGNPHSIEPNLCRLSTTLGDGDTLMNMTNGTESITNVGTATHTFKLESEWKVMHGDTDVTSCYAITKGVEGCLEILPCNLTVVTEGAKKVYDGIPLTNDSYTVTGAPDGYMVDVTVTGTQTEVGNSKNVCTVCVRDKVENDVTESGNFSIHIQEGDLIVVESTGSGDTGGIGGSGNEGNDSNMSGDIKGDGFEEGAGGNASVLFQVRADYSGRIYLRQESFGEYQYTGWANPTAYTENDTSPLYSAGKNLQSTGNRAANVTILAQTGSLPYWLPYYTAEFSGYTGNGDIKADGTWSGEYTLSYYPYTYTVNMVMSLFETGTTEYSRYVYEYYTKLPGDTRMKMLNIAKANGVSEQSTIYDVANLVSAYRPYNLQFKNTYTGDFAKFFFEKADGAVCQHYATAATAMLRAFGVPARYTVGYAVSAEANRLVDVTAREAHAWVEVYVNDFGWIPLEVTGSENGGSGSTQKKDSFTVKPIDILVPSVQQSTLEHTNEVEFVAGEDVINSLLQKGYRYEVTVQGKQEGVGKTEAVISSFAIFDANGKDVTDLFDVKYETGSLEIVEKIIIQITLESVQCTYDGTPKKYADNAWWTYTVAGASSEDDIQVDFAIGSVAPVTGIGKVTDEALLLWVRVTRGSEDITSNCIIKFSQQRLEVTQRELTFASETASKVYDGEALTRPDIVLTDGQGLLEGHYFVGEASGTVTDPYETVNNTIGNIVIYDESGRDVTYLYKIVKKEGKLSITL